MRPKDRHSWLVCLLALLASAYLCACSPNAATNAQSSPHDAKAAQRHIVGVLDEPDTTDFQCTTIHYTVAFNVFDRLAEIQTSRDGKVQVSPSLAESWEVSDDGLVYTFHLRPHVTFSNGSELTSSDVAYTFHRLLTHPHATNQDIAHNIVGAHRLEEGEADTLEGFRIIDDLNFEIRLEKPFSAFLACLCMPGASILDEQSTEAAGERFGKDPSLTIGTGSFVFSEWRAGDRLVLSANERCFKGAPACSGIDLLFVDDPEALNDMVSRGELDIVNIDDLADLGNLYLYGNEYADRVQTSVHLATDYLALNESIEPLGDVRVRRALQLSLNRQALLDATYGGSGQVENGIYPKGLYGYNPDLETIPYDPQEASRLLEEAGFANGFDLEIGVRSTTPRWQRQLVDMTAEMWSKVGVRASVKLLGEDEFMDLRKSGKLACYAAAWAADYDDPDNFVYTFFGTRANTRSRSICYTNEDAMERVRAARSILDEEQRIKEYQDLERLIVQQDAAWIPLFSRERHFLISKDLEGFTTAWNGWYESAFYAMSIRTS